MSKLNPGGRRHKVLAILSRGPATMEELRAATTNPGSHEWRKFWRVLGAMEVAGLIENCGFYRNTDAGTLALAGLDAAEASASTRYQYRDERGLRASITRSR